MEFKKLSYQCYFLHLSRAAIRIETELVYFCRSIFYAVFHRNTRIIYYASYILFSLINYCTSLIKNKLYLYFIKKKKKKTAQTSAQNPHPRDHPVKYSEKMLIQVVLNFLFSRVFIP